MTSRRRARGVRQLLAPFPDFTVAAECRDGAEVLAALDTLNPHVVFLDIQMPGVDGFEVIRRRTPDRMPIVVFLTAYDQFAIRAFDAQALDYLLKPVTEARFAATMKRLVRQLKTASLGLARAGHRRHDRARRDGRACTRHRLDRVGGQLCAPLDRRAQLSAAGAASDARAAGQRARIRPRASACADSPRRCPRTDVEQERRSRRRARVGRADSGVASKAGGIQRGGEGAFTRAGLRNEAIGRRPRAEGGKPKAQGPRPRPKAQEMIGCRAASLQQLD